MSYLLEKRTDKKEPLKIHLEKDTIIGKKNFPALSTYKNVSEEHAILTFHEQTWYVIDLGSEFGVYVNFVRIGESRTKVEHWNIIGLGSSLVDDKGFICVLHPVNNDRVYQGLNVGSLNSNLAVQIKHEACYKNEGSEENSSYHTLNKHIVTGKSVNLPEQNMNFPQGCNIVVDDKFLNEWKMNKYFECLEPKKELKNQKHNSASEQLNSLPVSNVELPCSHNFDAQSTTSSVESMNITKYPSKHILQQIEDSKKANKQSKEIKRKGIPEEQGQSSSRLKKKVNTGKTLPKETSTKHNAEGQPLKEKKKGKSKGSEHHKDIHPKQKGYKSKLQIMATQKQEMFRKYIIQSSLPVVECKKGNPVSSYSKDLSKYKIPHLSDSQLSKNESSSKENLNAVLIKTTMKKRPENYGSCRIFLEKEIKSPQSKTGHHEKRNSAECKEVANNSSKIESKVNSQSVGEYQTKDSKDHSVSKSISSLHTLPLSKRNCVNNEKSEMPKEKLAHFLSDADKLVQCTTGHKFTNKTFEQFPGDMSHNKADEPIHLHNEVVEHAPQVVKHDYTEKKTEQHTVSQSCNDHSHFKSCENNSCTKNIHENSLNNKLVKETVSDCNQLQLGSTAYLECSNSSLKDSAIAQCILRNNMHDCYSDLIKKIVKMNPKWVYEREMNIEPPPAVCEGAKKLPLSFESYEQYMLSFFPMLILELWEEMCFKSKPILDNNNINKFYFSVISFKYVNGIMILYCESLINESEAFAPTANNLVILNLKQEFGKRISTFGFIEKHECRIAYTDRRTIYKLLNFPREQQRNTKLWLFSVYVKSREKIVTNCLMEGNVICNLSDKIKLVTALSSLKSSPMLNEIIIPKWNTFSVSSTADAYISDFTCIQQNVSKTICDAIDLSPTKPKIVLLQGLPGSGKTNIITCIAEKLVKDRNRDMKILVVTSNSVALDKIGCQLVALNEKSLSPVSFICLSHTDKNLPIFVRYYAEKDSDYLKNETVSNKQNFSGNEDEFEIRNQNIQVRKCGYSGKYCQIENILKDTSVILATLHDCSYLFKMKDSLKFSCCIIDEVNQTTELDVLITFVLGINKFVLVGDPYQMYAELNSEITLKCKFQRSILERFHLYFEKKYNRSPSIILSNQFRMHTEIAQFPLESFYSVHPLLSSHANDRSNFFPFKPYVVFHDESEFSSNRDLLGTKFITSLCYYMIDKHPMSSIAIIVSSKKEYELYVSALKNFLYSNIEIGPVECFQGREKSIVIMAYYPNEDNSAHFFFNERKVNVALTRAFNSLIVCGNTHHQPLWNDIISNARLRGCYTRYTYENDMTSFFETNLLQL